MKMSFNFGTTGGQANANTGFGFGAAKTTATTGSSFSFGSPASAPATTTGGSFNFGSPATTSAGSTAFGTTPSLGFGTGTPPSQPATAAVAPLFNFGGPTATTTAAASQPAAAPTFNFAKPATTSSGFGLGGGLTTTTTATGFGLGGGVGGGLFGKPGIGGTGLGLGTAPNPTNLSLGASGSLFDKNSTATPFVGLGGIDISATQPKTGASIKDIKEKETLVPDEIVKTVDTLKNYIKQQKQISSEIARTSITKLSKVSSEIERLKLALHKIENCVADNYQATLSLRRETSRVNAAVDMACHTRDTPPGLQIDNNSPFLYFEELVQRYEVDLINIRKQIASTENHMRSITNPKTITPADFLRCMQQINESFISLAGRIHDMHQKVEAVKEVHLKLRRMYLNESINIFANLNKSYIRADTSHLMGRTPFTNMSAMNSLSYLYSNMATNSTQVSNHPQSSK